MRGRRQIKHSPLRALVNGNVRSALDRLVPVRCLEVERVEAGARRQARRSGKLSGREGAAEFRMITADTRYSYCIHSRLVIKWSASMCISGISERALRLAAQIRPADLHDLSEREGEEDASGSAQRPF